MLLSTRRLAVARVPTVVHLSSRSYDATTRQRMLRFFVFLLLVPAGALSTQVLAADVGGKPVYERKAVLP